jgi:hypothetical protein
MRIRIFAAVTMTIAATTVATAPNASATKMSAKATIILATSSRAGTATSSTGGIRIRAIYFNSPGVDTGTNTSLNAEWVRLKNITSTRKTLTGWTLRDASSHVYHFPTFGLAAGSTVRVHTGSGSNTASNLYWRSSFYIWNNTGDTAILKNASATTVDRCSYTSAADPEAFC